MDKIKKVADILKHGGVIAFPTDTVYGIGCSIFNEKAVERIYRIKGRSFDKPLPIILPCIDDIPLYAVNISAEAMQLINKYLPGALTVVLEKSDLVSGILTAGGNTVAIRVLNDSIICQILKGLAHPIAATSANRSGESDPLTAQDVIKKLGSDVDFVVDGGCCKIGRPSTIVDLTVTPFKILRQGIIQML